MNYQNIVKHYESCLEKHRQGPRAVDIPDEHAAIICYGIMLDMIPDEDCTLLDFGCGLSGLKRHMDTWYKGDKPRYRGVKYTGLDISEKFIAKCRELFPDTEYICLDLMKEGPERLGRQWDWVICNGVFTEKRELPWQEMWDYTHVLLGRVFQLARKGMAFNVMSKCVDWERDDLFHLPVETCIDFVKHLSRRFTIHHMDYGRYEYTTYVYRDKPGA
jgi:hypothetical protein